MSATALYVQACRCLYSNEMNSSWSELLTLLPQLRSALSCRVCRGLIVDPQSSRYCQHYVCRSCLKKKRALNPGCKWCLDWSKLEQSDRQVRVVLACYKLLCETIQSSDYYNNRVKGSKIDHLLKEAISNPDVLPESSYTLLKVSNIGQENTADRRKSRDIRELCARENVTNKVNKDYATKRVKRRQSRYFKGTSFISDLTYISKVSLMKENNLKQSREQLDVNKSTSTKKMSRCNNEVKQEIDQKRWSCEPKSSVLKGEINNNETGNVLLHNSRNLDKIETCLRSGNRRMPQSCKGRGYKKKRKLQQMIGTGLQNSDGTLCRSVDQCWKQRPRKQHKLDFVLAPERSAADCTTASKVTKHA